METIQVNKIFINYNIEQNRYDTIVYLVKKEIALYTNLSKLYMGKNFLLKRAIELIKTINSTSGEYNIRFKDNLPNYNHRVNNALANGLEKQIFINNFLFSNNEQFVHTLQINNIKLEDIENLIAKIIEKKKNAKITKNYELNIQDICNLDGICKYYNFNNKKLLINKILELYNLQHDLLKEKLSQKMR